MSEGSENMEKNIQEIDNNIEEIVEKPRSIPKPVWFILFYGLCEKYCLYGLTGEFLLFKLGKSQNYHN